MNFKYFLSSFYIRKRHDNLPVKSPRAQKRRIKNIGTVGCGNKNHAFIGFEAIHFHEQLIKRLFSFVMTSAKAGPAMAADSVNLINKNYAGSVLFGLSEQVPHTGRSDANKHFHKIGTADAQKRHFRFTG